MRFRAHQHLCRAVEIRAVREQGRRVECPAFTLWWRRRDPDSASPENSARHSRVCVVASTKAVGIAVRRNRARRRLREVFRHQQHVVPSGCDLLLIARSAVLAWSQPQLEAAFVQACRRITSQTPVPPPAAP